MGNFVALFIPDAFTPSQFADTRRSSHGSADEGVKNLLRALLEDALRKATGVRANRERVCYHEARYPEFALRKARLRKAQSLRLQREAIEWIFSDSDNGVFAFINICAALELDASALRSQTRRALESAQVQRCAQLSKRRSPSPRTLKKVPFRANPSVSSDSTFEQTFQRIAQL